jgi:hypothetical protein
VRLTRSFYDVDQPDPAKSRIIGILSILTREHVGMLQRERAYIDVVRCSSTEREREMRADSAARVRHRGCRN